MKRILRQTEMTPQCGIPFRSQAYHEGKVKGIIPTVGFIVVQEFQVTKAIDSAEHIAYIYKYFQHIGRNNYVSNIPDQEFPKYFYYFPHIPELVTLVAVAN